MARSPVAGRFMQLNSYSSILADASSFRGNQASLAGTKKFSAAFYGERRFMLKDIGSYQASFVLPTSTGNFGFAGSYFGGSFYNEMQTGLAFAKKLGKIDAGVQFNYYQFKTSGYDGASFINFEGGFILHISEQLRTGVHIYNPVGIKSNKDSDEKLPVVYSAGLGYDASESFFVGATIEKTENLPVAVNAGLQYAFDKKLFARAGISSGTSSFYFGAGVWLNHIRIDLNASVHPQLGITPGLMIVYNPTVKP